MEQIGLWYGKYDNICIFETIFWLNECKSKLWVSFPCLFCGVCSINLKVVRNTKLFVFAQPLQIVEPQTALVALIFFIISVSFILLLGSTVGNFYYTEGSLPGKISFHFSIRTKTSLTMGTAVSAFEPRFSFFKYLCVRWISDYHLPSNVGGSLCFPWDNLFPCKTYGIIIKISTEWWHEWYNNSSALKWMRECVL